MTFQDSAQNAAGPGAPVPDVAAVQDYWDRRPCNIGHSDAEIGTREYFDAVEARKYFVEPHIPAFAKFECWRGKRVLEIGCGIGTDAVNFARAGAEYTGVDLSSVSLALTRKRFETFGLTGTFHHANAEQLSSVVRQGGFDLVYSFGTIHHTPRQRAVIEQARQLIRDDGELRIMLYARNSWKAIMIEAGLDQPEAQAGCPIATTYTHAMVRELLRGYFEVVSLEQAHIFPYRVDKYRKHEYEIEPWFAPMPPDLFGALDRHFGWHSLIVGRPV